MPVSNVEANYCRDIRRSFLALVPSVSRGGVGE